MDTCNMRIHSYIHGMKLQVTKAQNVDQMGSALKNERYSDPCSLKIHSYIYGEGKKGKKGNSNVQHKTKQHEQRSI